MLKKDPAHIAQDLLRFDIQEIPATYSPSLTLTPDSGLELSQNGSLGVKAKGVSVDMLADEVFQHVGQIAEQVSEHVVCKSQFVIGDI